MMAWWDDGHPYMEIYRMRTGWILMDTLWKFKITMGNHHL
jgi:hypothetical protein